MPENNLMGCEICKGNSHQFCNSPGCKEGISNREAKKQLGVLEDISNKSGGWQEIVRHPILCDLCSKVAVYAHPMGGLRCDTCPRPSK